MSYVKGSQLPSTSTVADTDTLIVTQEGDSKATKKVAKKDLLKEDRTRLTNLETDNTTNKSNITNLQKSLENKAEKNHNHAISNITNLQTTLDSKASSTHNHDNIYVKQDGSTPITGPLQLKQGSYAHEAVGAGISGNWMLIAEINIKSNNINQPLEFNIAGRNRQTSVTLWILFKSTDNTDPELISFKYNNAKGYRAYLVKKATSTWSLYINKYEPYDFLDIIDVHIPKYTSIVVTYKSTTVSTLPEGGTYASPLSQDDKNITTLFERNNGTINKNINTCFNSSSGTFTAPEAGQYLVMCSGYELSSSSSEYVACVLNSSSSNQNKLYTTGSSGFTLITLNKGQTLAIYTATAGNINSTCISSNSTVNMLIARIN